MKRDGGTARQGPPGRSHPGGKIVEERVLPPRQPVTIGSGAKNTIVVPQLRACPQSFTLFSWQRRPVPPPLRGGDGGARPGPPGRRPTSARSSRRGSRKQGRGLRASRSARTSAARSSLGEVTAPLAVRRRRRPRRRGRSSRRRPRATTSRAWTGSSSRSWSLSLPGPRRRSTCALANTDAPAARSRSRRSRTATPRSSSRSGSPPPPAAEGGGGQAAARRSKAEEKKADAEGREAGRDRRAGGGAQGGARGRGRQGGPVEGHPQGARRARARARGGGAVADVFGAGGGMTDVAIGALRRGRRGGGDRPGRGRRAQGRRAGRRGLHRRPRHVAAAAQVGYGAKSEVKVTGSVAAEEAEVDSAEIDQGKLGAFVRARMGLIKACYENALKRNPNLKGKIAHPLHHPRDRRPRRPRAGRQHDGLRRRRRPASWRPCGAGAPSSSRPAPSPWSTRSSLNPAS